MMKEDENLEKVVENTISPTNSQNIPVIEEFVKVDREVREGDTIRVNKTVKDENVTLDLNSTKEEVQVERVPLNVFVDTVPETRQEGDTTIIPVSKEVVVIEKKIMLVEEIRITRKTINETDKKTVSLKKEVVEIKKISPNS